MVIIDLLQIPLQKVQEENVLKQSATDFITLLTNPPPSTVPFIQDGDDTKNALLKLELIFNRTDGTHNSLPNQKRTNITEAAELVPKQTTKIVQPQAPPLIKQTTPIKSNPTSLLHIEQTSLQHQSIIAILSQLARVIKE